LRADAALKGPLFHAGVAEPGAVRKSKRLESTGAKALLELCPDAALKGPLFHAGVLAEQCESRRIKAARKHGG